MTVYRARPIKRERRSKAQVEQLDRQIKDVIAEDHPQSVRHIFYRMTDPRLPEPVEKSDRGYRHVQDRVVKLRRSGRLSYGWISDTTRRGYHVSTFEGTSDFVRRMAGLYRADLWAQSDWYVEVWCESRSIAGVIQDSRATTFRCSSPRPTTRPGRTGTGAQNPNVKSMSTLT